MSDAAQHSLSCVIKQRDSGVLVIQPTIFFIMFNVVHSL